MYTQRAVGSFSVEVSGLYHCGPDHTSPKSFDYEVEVDWRDAALDSRGFLVDNLTFQSYFDGLKVCDHSCELLARNCAEALWAICGCKPKSVTLSIWAIRGHVVIHYKHCAEWWWLKRVLRFL